MGLGSGGWTISPRATDLVALILVSLMLLNHYHQCMSIPIIDQHMHIVSRLTNDYERAHLTDIEYCIQPAFWSGMNKQHAESFFDYFEQIIDSETDPFAAMKAQDKTIDQDWDREEVRKVMFENPYEFFDQSPNFDYES